MTIRYFLKLALFFAIHVFMSSCNHDRFKPEINQAEIEMEANDNPGESFDILKKIRYDSIESRAEKARYGYLYARAIHKLNQRMDTDLYIKNTVDYYDSKGVSPELMKALFYLSNYYYENELSEMAVNTIMKVRQLAIKYRDDYWRAKAAELLADILSNSHNNNESIKYRTEAAQYYSIAGREDNARYSYIDLAITYGNILRFDKSLELVDSILKIAQVEKDTVLMAYGYSTKYNTLISIKDFENGEKALNKFFSLAKSIRYRDYCYKAIVLIHKNELDSAEKILNILQSRKLGNRNKALVYLTLRNLYKKQELYKKALVATDSVFVFSDKDVRKSSAQILVATQRDYLDNDLTSANLRVERQKFLMLVGSVIAVIIIVFLVLIYRYRIRVKKAEMEKTIEQIMAVSEELNSENLRLSQTIEEHRDIMNHIHGQNSNPADIESLFREKWSMLNFLCNEYFERGESPKIRASILTNIERELKSFQSEESFSEIETAVNRYMNNIAEKLRQQCSFFNDSAFKFIILSMAGLSKRAICLILDLSYNYYFTKKQRIVSRIEQSDAPDRELFLQYLK